ncbi:hypothetical protein PIB30_089445 [Stylosanthes scabra]|uniref:Uncharacterized protein n=1 Tax=Stylosanthes scabra TaxID=79078 RepID=A0ABU6VV43_9FABA|nr:hypothetical protein [Stylosanthes scabra]
MRHQERREDALLHERDVERLNQEEVHEYLEEVEEENKDQEVEDVDQEVENEDKEQNGMEIVHSASSEATPPESPSKLHFEWVNLSNLIFIGPQHYGLLETDGQLRALCGVSNKKEMDPLVLVESMFITCGKSKLEECSGHMQKLHNNRPKVGQFQKKLVDLQSNGTQIPSIGRDSLLVSELLEAWCLQLGILETTATTRIVGNSRTNLSTSHHDKIFPMSNLKDNKQKAPTLRCGDSRLGVQSSNPGFDYPRLGVDTNA